jgi:CheY-like chemotaxis protein
VSRIMIAGDSQTIEVLQRLLSTRYELIAVKSMREAIAKIHSDQPDLILCGMLFEESRMFDLLRAVKADPAIAKTKFICSRVVVSDLPDGVMDTMTAASCALGASLFLDIFALVEQGQEADVVKMIDQCLDLGEGRCS